ncbi:MAG TPA: PD-(D/E)XK nuclease family protein [Pirellulaceae bacterium]|nr:PD-(D/E)XK nuclease family protein [Pirellulaceae bacterium]HMO91857.1 PD-(D/E)XK nuclease family protein [Pirellulaceae bacterium]HMP69733.1 PD-(D/E)XK nuclease family protein [Pirellulaceae bacterium]
MNITSIRRVWLDPERGVFSETIELLKRSYSQGRTWDMSKAVLGLPTSRACRRLLELLVIESKQAGATLYPPTICTLGQLPEFLYRQQHPLASDLVQRLAWTRALEGFPNDELRLVGSPALAEIRWIDRFNLARSIAELHRELAGHLYSFRDVLNIAKQNPQFTDHDRWELLHRLQMNYFKVMREFGTWDIQTARRFAVEKQECQTDREIWILGSVELNRAIRQMLLQVASQVTVLVAADSPTQSGFDPLGGLVPEFWESYVVPIDQQQVRTGTHPTDQALIAVDFVARLGDSYCASQIAVAVPETGLIPYLTRSFRNAGAEVHDATGTTIDATGPIRLLQRIREFLESRRYEELAGLLRHEDVYTWLTKKLRRDTWLQQLDDENAARFPFLVNLEKASDGTLLGKVVAELARLLGGSGKLNTTMRFPQWAVHWRDVLQAFYRGADIDRDVPESKPILSSLNALSSVLVEIESLTSPLQVTCDAVDSLRVVLAALAERQTFADRSTDAIEMMGWLDLIWDDAPVAIVTSFNEGVIPQSRDFHPFLPNRLRSQLGLLDNRMRLVRDKHGLNLLLKTRQQALFLVGRKDVSHYPMMPSRLLFGDDVLKNAHRLMHIIRYAEAPREQHGRRSASRDQRFAVPALPQLPKLAQLSVTDFDAYLDCPYRFYLTRILRLKSIEEQIEELDHAAVGSLIHKIIEEFGRSPLKDSTDSETIRAFLGDQLSAYFQREFARGGSPVLQIQRSQMEMRLDQYAIAQARRRREGWSIIESELSDLAKTLDVDGEALRISGRIDRVERHDTSKQIAVIDFKSSQKWKTSNQLGRKDGHWRSLQLPLYRWLVSDSNYDSGHGIVVGYGRIGQRLDDITFDIGNWSDEQFDDAISQSKDLVRLIRQNEFSPNAKTGFDDVFDRILQKRVFEKWIGPPLEAE